MIFEQIRHVHIEKNDMFQNITKLIYHICQVRDEIMIYIYTYTIYNECCIYNTIVYKILDNIYTTYMIYMK